VTEFTSGDIFGLFTENPHWHLIDLSRNYLEPAASPAPASPEAHTAKASPAPAR
jgi:hypothetical protein